MTGGASGQGLEPRIVDALAAELADALAADRVERGEDVRRQHGRDESWHPEALPDLVAYPLSTDEVVALVDACRARGAAIVPFGAGSSLEGHVQALRGGVCCDLSRMNRVLRLSVEDLDVTVEAGVTRRQLEARLRPEGVFFPVDPGADATIGGMVATGASGTTTVRYGAMRQNVLGLTVVTAAGAVVHTGSRARKSSAGYDLTRLFVGGEGTLGIVTEAILRVQPTPEAVSAAVCAFATIDDAVRCVIETIQTAVPVARIELLDPVQMDAINRRSGLAYAAVPTLFLEFHGGEGEVGLQARRFGEIAAEHGASGFRWTADEAERRALWEARHHAYESALALRPGAKGITTDVCVPVSQLAACIAATRADIDAAGLLAPMVGHVGDGNFHVVMLVDPDDPAELATADAVYDRLVERAIACGGTCTGEHGVGYGKARFLAREHGEEAVELMRAIKHALDPDGILNPGKVLPASGEAAP